MVSNHSDPLVKPPRTSDSHDVAPRRGSDDTTSVTSDKGKVAKPSTGPQHGMVAPLQLSRWRFWAIFISLMISIFLFALGMCSLCQGDM
jgi:hypothetical protein